MLTYFQTESASEVIAMIEKILREKMAITAEQDAFIKKLLQEVELK